MKELNIAQQLLKSLGFEALTKEPGLNPSYTKIGTGRRSVQGDGKKTPKQLQAGSFGRGLMRHWARKRLEAPQS